MTSAALVSVITSCLLAVAPLPQAAPGTLLMLRGTMTPERGDGGPKAFEIQVLLTRVEPAGAVACWTLDEQGPGKWSWPDRFGQVELDAAWRPTGGNLPELLYDRGDGKSQVPLVLPLLASGGTPLAADARWEVGKLEHRVVGTDRKNDQPTWRVEARGNYGLKRTFWTATDSPLVVAMRERVVIGQGQEHDLRLELASARVLSAAELATAQQGFADLLQLRRDLGQEPHDIDVQWNDRQLETLKASQSLVSRLQSAPLLAPLAKAIEQDLRSQKGRSGAIASLRDKSLGQPVPMGLKFDGLSGAALDSTALSGKLTVLHFWEYRDVPLEEPYGQTGFLDFLYRKHGKKGVDVFGVAVHEPADADPNARRRAMQAAGRFKSFMNLSYPLLLDDGTMLRKFGDPRVAGAKLPLWVVIGADGKVLEYHAGNYEVQRDRGLETLDVLVTRAGRKDE